VPLVASDSAVSEFGFDPASPLMTMAFGHASLFPERHSHIHS